MTGRRVGVVIGPVAICAGLAAPVAAYADAVNCSAYTDRLRALLAALPEHYVVTSFQMLPPTAGWAGLPCTAAASTADRGKYS